jgi:anti-anti-sigma factor
MDGDIQVLKFAGQLDTEAAQEIMPLVMKSFVAGARKLIFDLSEVPYISSMGLGVLVKAVKTFPGISIFAGMQPYVQQTMKLAAFDKLAIFAKTVDLAKRVKNRDE